jgi:hypothetical protein
MLMYLLVVTSTNPSLPEFIIMFWLFRGSLHGKDIKYFHVKESYKRGFTQA